MKFLNQLKKNWFAAMAVLIVTTSISQCDKAVAYLDEGADLKAQLEYDNKLDTALVQRFKDYKFMTNLMNSPFMIDWKRHEREKMVDDIKHKDSTKLKMSAYVSSAAGMDKKAMMDSLVVVMNLMKKGRLISNDQCIRNSKEYCRARGRHTMVGM